MRKGYIEVSQNAVVYNASRPSNLMDMRHDFVETNARVKDAVNIIREYGAKFSHYVHSIRLGRIAVYIFETESERVSIRLKNFSERKLQKIHSKTD